MSGSGTAAEDGRGLGAGSAPESVSVPAIGKLQAVMGLVAITRENASIARPAVGDPVHEGDLIETGTDGLIAIVFVDGTTFRLCANTRVVLDEFVYGVRQGSDSAVFRVTKGIFGIIAGKMAAIGRLLIDTPLGQVRSTGSAAGFGSLAFGVFTFGLIHELAAKSAVLDDGTIDYKDHLDDGTIDYREYYESLPHGVFTIHTKGDHPQDI